MSRRELLNATALLAAAAALAAGVAAHAAEDIQRGTKAMATQQRTGEPYDLAGKRLVFTNWFYVRQGSFAWLDEKGENVSVKGSMDPWGARFERACYPHGIRLVAQPAKREGPIIHPERPWEEDPKGIRINTIIQEDGKFRAWGGASKGSFYLESKDGRTWERPELGLVEFEGSRKNNLIPFPGGVVFKDPSAPDSERYKAVNLGSISREAFEEFKKRRPDGWEPRAERPDVGDIYAIRGAVSTDGLNWTSLPEPLVVEHSDTVIVAYYDERLRKHIIYTRNYTIGPRSELDPHKEFRFWFDVGRRSIGRTESDDFRRFPVSEVILEAGPDMSPSDLLYTNCRTCIPGAPDHHLMFPAIWDMSDDTTSIALASSYDGKHWHFVPGSPVFGTAPFGEWDGGCVFAYPNLIELPDGSFALPYQGYNVPHKYPRGQFKYGIGYAVWPKGRLVALEAPEIGEFSTVGIMPPRSEAADQRCDTTSRQYPRPG